MPQLHQIRSIVIASGLNNKISADDASVQRNGAVKLQEMIEFEL